MNIATCTKRPSEKEFYKDTFLEPIAIFKKKKKFFCAQNARMFLTSSETKLIYTGTSIKYKKQILKYTVKIVKERYLKYYLFLRQMQKHVLQLQQ